MIETKQKLVHLDGMNTAIERQIFTVDESFELVDILHKILKHDKEAGLLRGYVGSLKNIDQTHFMRKQTFGESTEADNMSKSEILNSVRNILRLCMETIVQPLDLNPFILQNIDDKVRQPDFVLKYHELKLDRYRVLTSLGEPTVEQLNQYWSRIQTYARMWKTGEEIKHLKYHFDSAHDIYTDYRTTGRIASSLKSILDEDSYEDLKKIQKEIRSDENLRKSEEIKMK